MEGGPDGPAVHPGRETVAPGPAAPDGFSSLCEAFAKARIGLPLSCPSQSQVSQIALGAIRSARKGPLVSGPLLAILSPQPKGDHMSKLFLPNNHCVKPETLRAVRARHPLITSATAYAPSKYQIGFGCRNGVHPGWNISPCQAEDLFRNDVMYVEAFLRMAVARRLTERAYQALVSFIFDVGPKSPHASVRLAVLHDHGEAAFFDGLDGGRSWSRFDENVGLVARSFEVWHAS